MRCPECGIEMRVENRSTQKGTLRLTFACRNPQCSRCGQVLAEKKVS